MRAVLDEYPICRSPLLLRDISTLRAHIIIAFTVVVNMKTNKTIWIIVQAILKRIINITCSIGLCLGEAMSFEVLAQNPIANQRFYSVDVFG